MPVKEIIPIHPCDLGAWFSANDVDSPMDVIKSKKGKIETLEIQGQLYRVSVEVPIITSDGRVMARKIGLL